MKFGYVPATLVVLAAIPSLVVGNMEFIRYQDDDVYVQSRGRDMRWMFGARGSDDRKVKVRNMLASDSEMKNEESYRWQVRSDMSRIEGDPKKGDCLRYGDTFYFYIPAEDRWLIAGTNDSNQEVETRNSSDIDVKNWLDLENYQWIARSKVSTGWLDDEDEDPAFGECVQDVSLLYFQSKHMTSRWLKGSHGSDGEKVQVYNIHKDSTSAAQRYQWIVRKSLGGGKLPDGALECAARPESAEGRWRSIPSNYNAESQTFTFVQGTSRMVGREETQTNAWKTSVTASYEHDWVFAGGSGKVEVSAEYSGSITTRVSENLIEEKSAITTSQFKSGTIWQFTYSLSDICETEPWDIRSGDLTLTDGKMYPPCCLPGMFVDNNNPHGPCVGDSPCNCSDEICYPDKTKRNLRH